MLTSEQLRVIYRLYKSVTCTAEFIFLTNMERVPQKRKDAELFFLRNMERVPQTIIYSFREEKL